MAKVYFEKLSQLIFDLDIDGEVSAELETKHFFSGAALYVNKAICVSWSPGGLAFKLSETEVNRLLSNGKAKPLKYFEKGHIKEGYAMFENPESSKKVRWKSYFLKAIGQVL
ncbi:MAG: hypothetical protein JKY29_12475 [Gammaproteobacteria bacterium]|nr:hypothetical protein [Gammaproteobacteria bacterium]